MKKIGLILLLIALLPALFYTGFELTNLTDQEEVIQQIYDQQLETFIFSVNQYCWDVTNSWAARINLLSVEASGDAREKALHSFLRENPAVPLIFLADSTLDQIDVFSTVAAAERKEQVGQLLRSVIRENAALTGRLRRYQQSGYRKIEPLQVSSSPLSGESGVILLFVLDRFRADQPYQFAGILLDPLNFIQEVAYLKINDIIGEQFCMIVYANDEIHSVHPPGANTEIGISEKKSIWLFPDYDLAIGPRGETIATLARTRFYRNLTLILLLDVILLAAVWVVYRNIRRAVDLAQLKSDFVSNISHELRTPLALIRMFSETLEMNRAPSEERKQEYYRIISQEADRLTHLVNNILNFSKIEAGRKTYNLQIHSLNDIIRGVLDKYQFHLENSGFHLEKALAENLPAVKADDDAIAEALINLLDNSIKYSDSKKRIRVSSGQSEETVFMEVADEGIGIPVDQQEKIFEKFHRVAGGPVHNTKGSGLGLALVRHIMEAHGGQVSVSSQPGRGSRFRLQFRKDGNPPAEKPPEKGKSA